MNQYFFRDDLRFIQYPQPVVRKCVRKDGSEKYITIPIVSMRVGLSRQVIAVKFSTAYGRSRAEVGSRKRIDPYGRKGVAPFSRIVGSSDQKITPHLIHLRAKTKLFLTYCV